SEEPSSDARIIEPRKNHRTEPGITERRKNHRTTQEPSFASRGNRVRVSNPKGGKELIPQIASAPPGTSRRKSDSVVLSVGQRHHVVDLPGDLAEAEFRVKRLAALVLLQRLDLRQRHAAPAHPCEGVADERTADAELAVGRIDREVGDAADPGEL